MIGIYKVIPNFIGILLLVISASSFADISPYNQNELATIKQYLLNNIATQDHVVNKRDRNGELHSQAGAVLASPSYVVETFSQDYQFHWIRDAAITMNEVISQYAAASSDEKSQLKPYLLNYVEFEHKTQSQQSRPGEETLGQPKFNIDGTIWEGDWGRPQNDGPALRAIALIHMAELFLQEGDEKYVQDHMLDMIAKDLDYVVTHWRQSSFDLWEEVNDVDHFFTKMVQRKSLIDGAELFTKVNQGWRATAFLHTAEELSSSLEKHWNPSRGYLTETVYQQSYKGGGLDSSIILGVLYGDTGNPHQAFSVTDERVLSTVFFIRNAFAGLYKINIHHPELPPLIGRYPNDIYDGDQFLYGNPWPLITNALAQYYYACANVFEKEGEIQITSTNNLFFQQLQLKLDKQETISLAQQPEKFRSIITALRQEGDALLANVKSYATCYNDSTCLHFNEQIDRTSGKQVSARDLTWGYATILGAMRNR